MTDRAEQREVERAQRTLTDLLDAMDPELVARSGREAVDAKADGTPVTAVDREVDERLRAGIADLLPGHGVVSEEGETRVPDTEWTWVIDPIDGTSNYTTGVPYWCVSAALTLRGTVVLAVVDAPALQRRYVARRGHGTTRNGEPVHVRPTVEWGSPRNRHLAVMLSTATARRARDAGVRLNVRVMGSTALDLALVADGGAIASVAVIPHVWDIAAGGLLVEEAGGGVATVRGEPMLPLQPGVDHRSTSAVTAAAADARYATRLCEALLAEQ